MAEPSRSERAFHLVLGGRRGAGPAQPDTREPDVARVLRHLLQQSLEPGSDLLDLTQRAQAAAAAANVTLRPGLFRAADRTDIRFALSAVVSDAGELVALIETDPNTAAARLFRIG
jgi:hypothetical protein